MKILQFIIFAYLLSLLSACAIGNKHPYHDMLANIQTDGAIAVAVSTHDQREYVIYENKNPTFVGLMRGGYGNPFDIITVSGNPPAEDITKSIILSLNKKGFQAIPVISSYSENRNSVIDRLKEKGADRLLLVTVNEWKSDTYANTALIYNVDANIFDKEGNILGSSTIEGRDNLGGSFMNPPAHAREAVPRAFKEKIEELLNNEDIISNLH